MRRKKIQLSANIYVLPEDVAGEELGTFLSVITRSTPLDYDGKEVTPGDWQAEISITDYIPAEEENANTPYESN